MNFMRLKITKSSEKIQSASDVHMESSWQTMEIDMPVENADTQNGRVKIKNLKNFFLH